MNHIYEILALSLTALGTLGTVLVAAIRNERRMTRIETMLNNHLKHHEDFITPILKQLAGVK